LEDWRYQELYELEDRHWWFRGRRAVIWSLVRSAGVPPAPRILDAGCGTGRNLVEFGALGEAEGVHFSEQAVAYCRDRGLPAVQQAPLEQLPFPDGRFDLILATDVIEHLEDDRRALVELRRVAAPGARLIITVPAYDWIWSQHDESHHHQRRYTLRRLRSRVVSSGWEPVLGSYFFATFLPAAAVVRAVRRWRPGREGRSDLELTPARINRALELPGRAEARLVERGFVLPAGLSIGMACAARGST
jgi:SAM-dependent methyltransferase